MQYVLYIFVHYQSRTTNNYLNTCRRKYSAAKTISILGREWDGSIAALLPHVTEAARVNAS
jgi:hypothetical protein